MYQQAPDLREFYSSMLGRVALRVLRPRLRHFWPDVHGERILGVGYATPFLRPFAAEAERVAALMPARQGAVFWSSYEGAAGGAHGQVCLCEEDAWPIETSSVDRIIVVHGVPGAENLDAVLRESWRVLTGQGRLLLIVPNRAGVWARFDHTPFGQGSPFSVGQIRQHLRDYLFVPERAEGALFMPPTASRMVLSAAPIVEKLGRTLFNAFGGVNIIEASKQVYAGHLVANPQRVPVLARRRYFVGSSRSMRDGQV
jgi:hypothetical protein